MSKRNSNFSIYAHLRMLLKAIPMRNEATLRLAVAARLEADEATGEIFNRGSKSARLHLQDVANVPRNTSMNEAMAELGKIKLIQGTRQYSRGERKKGGDRLVLNWSQWEEACFPVSENQASDVIPAERESNRTVSGNQPDPLSGSQHIEDTATVTATATALPSAAGAEGQNTNPSHGASEGQLSSSRRLSGDTSARAGVAEATCAPGLPMHLVMDRGVLWGPRPNYRTGREVKPYVGAVWQHKLGKVYLVQGEMGEALFASLRFKYTPSVIQRALELIGPAVASARRGRISQGLLESILEQACVRATESGSRRGPVDYGARDAVRNVGRYSDV